jgi:hypothetical protein
MNALSRLLTLPRLDVGSLPQRPKPKREAVTRVQKTAAGAVFQTAETGPVNR